MSAEQPPRYRFGPRSTRGLIAGWRGGQIACVAVSAVLALGLLRSVSGLAGAAGAFLVAGVGVALAVWPVGGRSVEEWLPTLARFASASLADGRSPPWLAVPRSRRSTLDRLVVRALPHGGERAVGMLEDQEASSWTAVLPVGGVGFALLDEAGQATAVAAWSGVLSAMAAEARDLRHLQWICRTYPARLDASGGGSGTSASGLVAESFAASSYRQFLAEAAPHLWAREVLLALSVAAPRASVRRRDRVEQGSGTAGRLIALLDSLSERLLAAGLVVGEPLTVGGVAAAMRRGYDEDPPGGPVLWPWPTGVSAHWSTLRTDGVVHATYWVSEWPRGEVGPGFLLPLLIGSGHRRTVAVTMAPVGPENAVRRAERERTSGAADAELRRRHGFAMTARARLEQDLRQQRESELADGHAGFAYSGYVTVTEPDEAALDRACTEVEQAAALAQLDLRRLYGTQEAAWCCTLPTGRGCR